MANEWSCVGQSMVFLLVEKWPAISLRATSGSAVMVLIFYQGHARGETHLPWKHEEPSASSVIGRGTWARNFLEELASSTVARESHTFHACFRDKRYAEFLDTRQNEPRRGKKEQSTVFSSSIPSACTLCEPEDKAETGQGTAVCNPLWHVRRPLLLFTWFSRLRQLRRYVSPSCFSSPLHRSACPWRMINQTGMNIIRRHTCCFIAIAAWQAFLST